MTASLPESMKAFEATLARHRRPTVAFWTLEPHLSTPTNSSHLGGSALLPSGFTWPASKRRPLDFLLQLDLRAVSSLVPDRLLPSEGLLTFFYDLDNQPWGYDPNDLDGFRVVLVSDVEVSAIQGPEPDLFLPQRWLDFGAAESLPTFGSRAYDRLTEDIKSLGELPDDYFDYQDAFERQFYPLPSGRHRLFGHSTNVQGDMQLEAQLVTNGLYCGDSSGYHDPRASVLEPGADDWLLLLQLDSDDEARIMWGDLGMLYFWIRRDDLQNRRFDKVWMTLQCG